MTETTKPRATNEELAAKIEKAIQTHPDSDTVRSADAVKCLKALVVELYAVIEKHVPEYDAILALAKKEGRADDDVRRVDVMSQINSEAFMLAMVSALENDTPNKTRMCMMQASEAMVTAAAKSMINNLGHKRGPDTTTPTSVH